MARRAAWFSVAVSALVGLIVLDQWAETETPRPSPPPHPLLTASLPPPDAVGPTAALVPISLPPPPRVEAVPEATESAPPAEPPPPAEPDFIVRPMKASPPPPPAPERAGKGEPRTPPEIIPKIAIQPLRPSPQPSPPTMPEATAGEAAPAERVEAQSAPSGRVLLRLLEHGSGPTVEIAWPARPRERERLFDRFLRCYGMTVAVMDEASRLFVTHGPPGQSWAIDLDRYSGFVRQAKGSVTRSEGALVRAIEDRHPGLRRGRPVHVFPRAADAALLGGLRHLVGEDYAGARTIRAAYRLDARRIFVEDVRVGGKAVAGRIDLSGAGRPNCA
jgi:hypothetical protein